MANYYCIMAGVPELQLSDTHPGYSIQKLREELQTEMGGRDENLLRVLFLGHDCRNLVRLLRNNEAELEPNGNYSREELLDLMEKAAEIDLGQTAYPEFLIQFVRDFAQNAERKEWYAEDEVLLLYYQHCIQHCPDSLMRRWYQMNLDVTNLMTAMIARKQGWKVGDFVKGEGEVQDMIRTNDQHDFSLSNLYDFVPEVMKIVDEDDPVRKERMLDAFKWAWLDEQTFADVFSIEAVFAYLCKLEIQERWSHLDVEQGKETFEQLRDAWYRFYGYSNAERAMEQHYNNSRYHILNLHRFFSTLGTPANTVEVRAFNSSLHAGVVRGYVLLVLSMNASALTQKNIRAVKNPIMIDGNEKFAMRTWLNRMGWTGEMFKNPHKLFIKRLQGDAAWRFGRSGDLYRPAGQGYYNYQRREEVPFH